MTKAYFVRYPSRIEDLKTPHLINRELPYEVVKEVILAALCSEGNPMKCLFIHQRGKKDGVLAVPDPKHTCFVRWAAYVAATE